MERIGSITALDGRVTAVGEAGQARVLGVGDPVHADETLITALGATATVRLHCGSELRLGHGALAVLDADVFEPEESADSGSVRLTDVQRVLGWLQSPAHRSVA